VGHVADRIDLAGFDHCDEQKMLAPRKATAAFGLE
jgi:hypothetical protein